MILVAICNVVHAEGWEYAHQAGNEAGRQKCTPVKAKMGQSGRQRDRKLAM